MPTRCIPCLNHASTKQFKIDCIIESIRINAINIQNTFKPFLSEIHLSAYVTDIPKFPCVYFNASYAIYIVNTGRFLTSNMLFSISFLINPAFELLLYWSLRPLLNLWCNFNFLRRACGLIAKATRWRWHSVYPTEYLNLIFFVISSNGMNTSCAWWKRHPYP